MKARQKGQQGGSNTIQTTKHPNFSEFKRGITAAQTIAKASDKGKGFAKGERLQDYQTFDRFLELEGQQENSGRLVGAWTAPYTPHAVRTLQAQSKAPSPQVPAGGDSLRSATQPASSWETRGDPSRFFGQATAPPEGQHYEPPYKPPYFDTRTMQRDQVPARGDSVHVHDPVDDDSDGTTTMNTKVAAALQRLTVRQGDHIERTDTATTHADRIDEREQFEARQARRVIFDQKAKDEASWDTQEWQGQWSSSSQGVYDWHTRPNRSTTAAVGTPGKGKGKSAPRQAADYSWDDHDLPQGQRDWDQGWKTDHWGNKKW
jgi:hypothetical protein